MSHLLENVFMSKELFQSILAPVCEKYAMTQTEMAVLLFLANHPQSDTATDIVENQRLTKSAVSIAARSLQEKGLIMGEYVNGNHRSIHLKVCDAAREIVSDGNKSQEIFFDIITAGFSETDKDTLKDYFERITANIKDYHNSLRK